MQLYDNTSAPNPRRVRIFLAEKGVEVPRVPVDIAGAENRSAPFVSKNPMGQLPALELDDGTVIAETVAICRYFEETHPDPPLMGVGPAGRASVEMWQRRMEFEVFRNITQVFVHTHDFFRGRVPQVPDFGEVSRKLALERLAWLDGELADRPFIAGDDFTIADITAICGIDFGRVVGIRIEPEHSHLSRWHASVSARPSAGA